MRAEVSASTLSALAGKSGWTTAHHAYHPTLAHRRRWRRRGILAGLGGATASYRIDLRDKVDPVHINTDFDGAANDSLELGDYRCMAFLRSTQRVVS
jgi:hypothetical protein